MTARDTDSFELFQTSPVSTDVGDEFKPKSLRRWYHELPLALTALLVLIPQPSVIYVIVNFHWRLLHSTVLAAFHLAAIDFLTFLTFSSLIVCIARDPGPIVVKEDTGGADGEMGLTQALMTDDFDFSAPGKWCRKCWAPKPERAHHCSTCGRCVLKQDHHCPWLGSRCIGHRTYPAFIHFLASITLLASYVAGMSFSAMWFALHNPLHIDETTPLHAIFLGFYGLVFALVIGSFFVYHIYLVTSNQTTIEHLNPFLLLRHLPPLPPSGHTLSDPPIEPELSYVQRRIVRDAHAQVRVYDVGWRQNWAQVFGWSRPRMFFYRLWLGGASSGNGTQYSRNAKSERQLARLAEELVKADKDRSFITKSTGDPTVPARGSLTTNPLKALFPGHLSDYVGRVLNA